MIVILMALAQIGGTILWAAVFSQLWLWFVVPLNDALPVIGIAHAWGLQTTACGLLTARGYWGDIYARVQMKKEDHLEERVMTLLMALFAPLVVLGMGWIARVWMA